ncbi:MAG: hypothetical protein IJF83_06995 [Methanobrevibacter sp.]|nr:hypothetical protein [Methanobrevibacter sp.]
MSIEESVYKLKTKYLEPSYGRKMRLDIPESIEDFITQSDLILERKDGKPINIDDYVILSKEDYIARLKSSEYHGKLELLNEIFEDNLDNTCITGCNIEME